MTRLDENAPEEGERLTAEAEANETILVVEDDADVRTFLAETLRAGPVLPCLRGVFFAIQGSEDDLA